MNTNTDPPSFNLWHEPWITAERPDGKLETLSIKEVLLDAPTYRALYDSSPLVIASIHRLLVAILQDIFNPQDEEDLYEIWHEGLFFTDQIEEFEQSFAHRFELFSEDAPFMQTADIPLYPLKKGKGKSVGYLFQEENAGTAVTHYFHSYDKDHRICPACCAKGLVFIPAFASSGGAGIKPSINGVPPIYVLPGGENLFQSLVASLTSPEFQPDIARPDKDEPWWRRENKIVAKKGVVSEVGYAQSLTFPARRIRLHPEKIESICSRCHQPGTLFVTEMAFEMGEQRPDQAAFWQDPFAAYKIRKDGEAPIPIRPIAGKALWREFEALFLPTEREDGRKGMRRPKVIDQLSELEDVSPFGKLTTYPFQVIGVRTDMKAKTFEWEHNGFQVPPTILADAETALRIKNGITFADDIDQIIKKTFTQYFGGDGKQKRGDNIKWRMSQAYWGNLAQPFDAFVIRLSQSEDQEIDFHHWLDLVQDKAIAQFNQHANMLGKESKDLENKVKAISHNRAKIYGMRNKKYPKREVTV